MSDLSHALARPTALVVVDMQNDYCVPEGVIGSLGYDVSAAAGTAERIAALIEAARPLVDATIFVRTEIPDHFRPPALAGHYARNPLGRRVAGNMSDWFGVARRGGDTVVTKHRYLPFVDTPFAATKGQPPGTRSRSAGRSEGLPPRRVAFGLPQYRADRSLQSPEWAVPWHQLGGGCPSVLSRWENSAMI